MLLPPTIEGILNYFFREDNSDYDVPLILWTTDVYDKLCRNVSSTPLRQWGFRQCLPFSWTTLRGKHCRHPIAVMGVVDTFRLSVLVLNNVTLQKHFALKLQFTYPSFSYSFFSSMLVLLFNQINEQFCNCQHDHYYSEFMGKRC